MNLLQPDKSLIEQIRDDCITEFGDRLTDEQLELMVAFASVGILFKVIRIIVEVEKEFYKK